MYCLQMQQAPFCRKSQHFQMWWSPHEYQHALVGFVGQPQSWHGPPPSQEQHPGPATQQLQNGQPKHGKTSASARFGATSFAVVANSVAPATVRKRFRRSFVLVHLPD